MEDNKKRIRAIIPAAGKGSRLHSENHNIPKAMHKLCGTPILKIVLENTSFINPDDTYIVVGFMKDSITSYFGPSYHYIEQKEQLGTGHAVFVCEEDFRDFDGCVLVTFGDMPMFRYEILKKLCEHHIEENAACTILTAENSEIENWAKMIRDENGNFVAIKEGKDCVGKEKDIKELFAGVFAFDSKSLFKILPMLTTNNVQNEYYLTQVPEIMVTQGMKISTYPTDDENDLRGVNTKEDLVICEEIYKKRMSK